MDNNFNLGQKFGADYFKTGINFDNVKSFPKDAGVAEKSASVFLQGKAVDKTLDIKDFFNNKNA